MTCIENDVRVATYQEPAELFRDLGFVAAWNRRKVVSVGNKISRWVEVE
jgi:hypothetical protein